MKKRSKVYTLKLVNGDDIVVNVLSKTIGGSWTVKDAIVMHQVPAGEGKMQVAVLPFLPYSAPCESFEILDSHIITCTEPSEEILNQYNNVFGSGIVIPKKEGIII